MWNHDAKNQDDTPMKVHASAASRLPEAYFNISIRRNHLCSQLAHIALDVKGSWNRAENNSGAQSTCGFRC